MAEIGKYSMDHELGCGFFGGICQLKSYLPRKTPVVPALPAKSSTNTKTLSNDNARKPPVQDCSRRRSSSVDSAVALDQKSSNKPNMVTPRSSTSHTRRLSDAARSSTSSSSSSGKSKASKNQDLSLSTEIARVITSDLAKQSNDKALVRATSSNVMLLGRLGNLRQKIHGNNNSPNTTAKTVDYLHKNNLQEGSPRPTPRYKHSNLGGNAVMGNIVKQPSGEIPACRGLMSGMDPEALKNTGNEAYKQGKFNEALALYDRAIALDSSKATYRSNRSAALIGLGRLVEAVDECKEAINLDPSYQRAHHRLATLYVRLGMADKALYHYNHSASYADTKEIAQTQALQKHLNQCIEARRLQEWKTLLKQTHYAISSGADSAPQIYALRAEALLKLNRHQEAYAAYHKGPNFSIESCSKIFGLAISASLLMVTAQVCIAAGRFEDAVSAAQNAARLDPRNQEVQTVVKRARAVASARLSGNLLYKASKFSEACIVYSEGLEHDPFNSVLLCNRAACRSKLGQFEKAVEDCNTALNVQPSYNKARLRRADCYAKMERWEAAIEEYEMLIRETPGDEEVGRALFEVKVQLKKAQGEDTKDMKFGSNLVSISSNELFRQFVTSPGMTVVLFCYKEKHNKVLQLMEQICKRFPSVSFLKVEVEDHPYIAKSEGVSSIPAFKIYKNGSKIKEIPGNNRELLEKSVKLYST